MNDGTGPKYRIDTGVPRRVRGREARAKIDRELHGAVIATGSVRGRVPDHMADWMYDLRRKQLRVYGGLLRFIDLAAQTGTPREVVERIPGMLASYIADAYDDWGRAA